MWKTKIQNGTCMAPHVVEHHNKRETHKCPIETCGISISALFHKGGKAALPLPSGEQDDGMPELEDTADSLAKAKAEAKNNIGCEETCESSNFHHRQARESCSKKKRLAGRL